MPHISLATSEVIKRRLFRAREHLQSLGVIQTAMPIFAIAQASYELCSGLKLPAVKHIDGLLAPLYLADAITNLTTAIDFELTALALDRDPEEVLAAASEILHTCQEIELPAAPPSHHP